MIWCNPRALRALFHQWLLWGVVRGWLVDGVAVVKKLMPLLQPSESATVLRWMHGPHRRRRVGRDFVLDLFACTSVSAWRSMEKTNERECLY